MNNFRVTVQERRPSKITGRDQWRFLLLVDSDSLEKANDIRRRLDRAFPEQHYDTTLSRLETTEVLIHCDGSVRTPAGEQ